MHAAKILVVAQECLNCKLKEISSVGDYHLLSTSLYSRQVFLNSKTAFSDNEIREHVAYGHNGARAVARSARFILYAQHAERRSSS